MTLPQEEMLAVLRNLCQQDTRIEAAMLYGSFVYGEADEFSDLDVILYFADEALKDVDQRAWVAQIRPVELFYVNGFGSRVAIFDNLVRGEFHFDRVSNMHKLGDLHDEVWFPSPEKVIVLDRHGSLLPYLRRLNDKLERDTTEKRQYICDDFLNWFLFGMNVLARGEHARALEILQLVHDNVLHMARLDEQQTEHWITPTRALERELSIDAYARYAQCTAGLNKSALWNTYRAAWQWGKAWIQAQHPGTLLDKLETRFSDYYRQAMS